MPISGFVVIVMIQNIIINQLIVCQFTKFIHTTMINNDSMWYSSTWMRQTSFRQGNSKTLDLIEAAYHRALAYAIHNTLRDLEMMIG